MNKFHDLNTKLNELEHNGDISEEEYATYQALLAERRIILECARNICDNWGNSDLQVYVRQMSILIDESLRIGG